MIVYRTKDLRKIHAILSNPIIQQVTSGCKDIENFQVNKSFKHLLFEKNAKIVGCFQYRHMSSQLVETHINILPQYWGEDFGVEATLAAFNWLARNTKYKKAWTDVPSVCFKVLGLMDKIDAKICGVVKNGAVYNNNLTDLMFFERDL